MRACGVVKRRGWRVLEGMIGGAGGLRCARAERSGTPAKLGRCGWPDRSEARACRSGAQAGPKRNEGRPAAERRSGLWIPTAMEWWGTCSARGAPDHVRGRTCNSRLRLPLRAEEGLLWGGCAQRATPDRAPQDLRDVERDKLNGSGATYRSRVRGAPPLREDRSPRRVSPQASAAWRGDQLEGRARQPERSARALPPGKRQARNTRKTPVVTRRDTSTSR